MSQANVELVLRGYRAFVEGDFDTVAGMLDPDIEWSGVEPEGSAGRDDVLEIIARRFADGHRLEIERCVGVGDRVAVSFRVAGIERDVSDNRPLQTRRYFTVGRFTAVVTVRDGRVVHVHEYPHLTAALEAIGIEDDSHA
jgi:ketosteroid isomerase-like protein